ncbi:hypothetical protein [Kribbella caucasensis]|uniref:hypothetical protein n=1 Tax=Kribbella caucasensis TaxID=2512215 RepID=UPI00192D8AAF|nr:hypothetical protein [Kribbella sp. VKM Ac-2527]
MLVARDNDLVIAVTPLLRPSARVVAAAVRAGALGVLDLTGPDQAAGRQELALVNEWVSSPFGVRVDARFTNAELPAAATTVLLADPTLSPADFPDRRVLVEVTSVEEARAAVGAAGLIARGHEVGGRVGELSTFVLLQRLLADDRIESPIWAWGGIGPRTASAAVVGGAAGVVLDTQLALLAEADLPVELTTSSLGWTVRRPR